MTIALVPTMRRTCGKVQLIIIALLMTVAVASFAAPNPALNVQIHMVGDEIRADVSFFVAAPQQRVWEVITDYERAPQFTRDLQVSRILARNGDTIRLQQKAQVRFGPFTSPVESVKDIRLTAPSRTESRLVSGTMKKHDSTTELFPENGGTRVRVRSIAITDSVLVMMAGEDVVKRETEERFRELRAEILRREHLAASSSR
jgi:carbon monoxide dehydrogenase subunit G